MNASSFVSPPQLLALARELELPSCVCEQLVQTAVPALLDACAAQCMALTAPDTAFPAWKHLEAQFSGRDPDGMQILALYLAAACRTREKYRMMCNSGRNLSRHYGLFLPFFAGGQSPFRPVHI